MSDKNNVAVSNFSEFMNIAEGIQFKRDPDDLFDWLTKTDYFIAPGSTKYHDSTPGGLYRHSKRVYECILHLNLISKIKYSDETLFYVAFGHDFAKINGYKVIQKWRKDDSDKNAKWEQYNAYQFEDDNPIPHGSKSAYLLEKYIPLTDAERLAVIYHMGSYQVSTDYMSDQSFRKSRELYPLVSMLHLADVLSVDVVVIDDEA